MKIAIDIDEVIVDFTKGCLPLFNSTYGKDVKPEDMHNYNWRDVFDITKDEEQALFEEFFTLEEFENLSLINGAYEGLRSLVKNYEVGLVTHRPPHTKEKTQDYFRRKFPDIELEIQHSFNGRKSEICPSQGYHLIVEDHGGCAYDCANVGMIALLFNHYHNQNQKPHDNLIRVYNWDEVLKEVENANRKIFS